MISRPILGQSGEETWLLVPHLAGLARLVMDAVPWFSGRPHDAFLVRVAKFGFTLAHLVR